MVNARNELKKALVVDDDDLVRSTVSALLQSLDFQVSESSGGTDVLRLLSESAFDLIVTDLFMPETDGIELILEIRKVSSTIPVVLMTGGGKYFPHGSGSLDELTESAEFFGASFVIHKPFRRADFAAVIRKAVPESP